MTRRPATADTRHRAPRSRGRGRAATLPAVVIGTILALAPAFPHPLAQERPTRRTEAEVRAGFLLGFPAYVVWPKESLAENAALVIGVVDAPEIAGELRERLDELRRKDEEAKRAPTAACKARRPVEVREIDSSEARSVEQTSGCHILYLSGEVPAEKAGRLLAAVESSATLTVEDRGRATAPLAVIELYIEEQRLRFAVRLEALRARGLEADSRMLRLGAIIDEKAERETPPRKPSAAVGAEASAGAADAPHRAPPASGVE